jgi:4-amino-4-deoxy-L-arabinose transferase-like glycosyltransferase
MDTTESRYAEIAREMVATGDWVTPRLDLGVPFLAKPPLSFWLTATSFRAFGLSEFAARLPSWLLSVFMVWLVYVLGARLRGVWGGLVCAVFLATSGLFYALAGTVMTDIALAAGVTLCLVAFASCVLEREGARRRGVATVWGTAFFLGLAAVMLAKGPVGVGFVLAPVFLWTWHTKRWGAVARALPWVPGTLLALALAAPWFLLMEKRNPGFSDYFFVGEHFRRFFVPHWVSRYGGSHNAMRGTIWAYFLASTLPWSAVLLVAGFRRVRAKGFGSLRTQDPWILFALYWLLTPVLLFTVSQGIMFPYVLPSVPGFAMLCALLAMPAEQGAPEWSRRPRRFALWAGVAAFSPAVLCLMFLDLSFKRADFRSQRNLVAFCKKLSHQSSVDLVYLGSVPYSAQFYSEGHVHGIEADDAEGIEKEFGDTDVDYFAYPEKRSAELPASVIGRSQEVARIGDYCLRVQRD